jgi:intein/homing endonuclease
MIDTEDDFEELTGPEAIQRALQEVDLDLLEASAKAELKKKKKSTRKSSVQTLQAIDGLRKSGVKPQELMVSKIPVVPPLFRPYAITGDTFTTGHSNELYRDLMESKKGFENIRETFGDDAAKEAGYNLYNATRALYGYGEAVNPKTKARGVTGFMSQILGGGSPKFSVPQRRLFSKTTDSVSRSVITIDPEMDIDQIGLPRHMAMEQYAPHVQRELVRQGYSNVDAIKQIKDNGKAANKVLEDLVKTMPVVYSRAPAWHKYNVLGGWVKLTEGDSISTNPYVMAGLGGDFDGDQQVNTMVVAFPAHIFTAQPLHKFNNQKININLLLRSLQKELQFSSSPENDEENMKELTTKTALYLNPETHLVAQVDLEDFIHGELSHQVDGANGPIDFFHAIPGTKVLAMDEQTNQPVWADVAYYSKHYSRKIELVHLSNGNTIITDNDPRAVYGINPNDPEMKFDRWTPTEAKELGIKVPVVKDMEKGCFSSLEEVSNVIIDGDQYLPLTKEFGYFLGAIAGDGWWDKKTYKSNTTGRYLYLADLTGFTHNRILSFMSDNLNRDGNFTFYSLEMLKEKNPSRYGDTVKYSYRVSNSIQFTEWLSQELGGEGDEDTAGSANKHLPSFYLNAPKDFREGLILGLMDTDGSISISHGKGNPQLVIQFTSTSLRLVREVNLLLKSVGIRSTIGFGKLTTRGNKSWALSISSADAKAVNLFSELSNETKRNNFISTPVSELQGSASKFEKVIFPTHISELFRKYMKSPKVRKEDRENKTPEVLRKMEQQNHYILMHNASMEGLVSPFRINAMLEEVVKIRTEDTKHLNDTIKLLETSSDFVDDFTLEKCEMVRRAIRIISDPKPTDPTYKEVQRILNILPRPLKEGELSPRLAVRLANYLKETPREAPLWESPVFLEWYTKFATNKEIYWTSIESVEYTESFEDGYDLTVPGYETFMALDGTILSNTVTVHLPAMKESQEEAKNVLMPSKMVLSTKREDTVVPTIKHEQILGLYAAKNKPSQNKFTFQTRQEAMQAIKKGEVRLSDDVEILDEIPAL